MIDYKLFIQIFLQEHINYQDYCIERLSGALIEISHIWHSQKLSFAIQFHEHYDNNANTTISSNNFKVNEFLIHLISATWSTCNLAFHVSRCFLTICGGCQSSFIKDGEIKISFWILCCHFLWSNFCFNIVT